MRESARALETVEEAEAQLDIQVLRVEEERVASKLTSFYMVVCQFDHGDFQMYQTTFEALAHIEIERLRVDAQ